ncbi:MAG TPA: efflux RND transporter periplasmic adaptor subunit [Thermoanaerobaculia bacterium]|nr:efflux RND transporter periplasmic adaptor subunit [Thermoanaerobaculia bacterium]
MRYSSARTTPSAAARLLLPAMALVLMLAALAGCAASNGEAAERPARGREAEAEADQKPKSEAIPVAALPLATGRIESVRRYSTNLEAERSVEVLSEADRRVVELLVEEGDTVEKGQVLLRLQDEEQESALTRVQSQLDKARREYERQKSLFEQELISEQAWNQATYELEQLQIARDDAERELSYATVRAPISGVITARHVSVGAFVQTNQKLFDLVDFASLVARIYVPERELARLDRGQPARIVAQALGSESRPARIDRVAPTVDSRSGTVKVTLALPDRRDLVPGMFVEVELVAGVAENALLVPKRALIYDEDQIFLYRVGEDRKAERLRVAVELEEADAVSVAEGAVAEGDLIVVAGQAGLRNGAEVRVLDPAEALATFANGQITAPSTR